MIFRISLFFIICSVVGAACTSCSTGTNSDRAELRPWIDTHAHPNGYETSCMTATCIESAIATMDAYGVAKSIFFSPPSIAVGNQSDTQIAEVVAMRPDRLFLGVGGAGLNPLIQQTPDEGVVSEALRLQFLDALQTTADIAGAVVFGEIASLHLSYSSAHPYEETQADTPLLLLLAEQAASSGLPIDLHMDVVSSATSTPRFFLDASSNNPAELQENVTALKALLDHRTDARIVLAHVGRDTTGQMTAALIRQLVETHANLYLQLHPVSGPLRSSNAIVDSSGTIRAEWLMLIEDYADRVVLGSDNFYTGTEEDEEELVLVKSFLDQLPEDLARQIGCENPVTIYRLSSGC